MAMNSEQPVKHSCSGSTLEQRVAALEARLAAREKMTFTTELYALRVEIAKIPLETIKGLLVVFGLTAAITATITFWF